ncbi:MAG: hypothetical protein M1817_005511 [Caeruleum heppii]|nr:MAG: hypothetical protein M1817_005511 [Caeruleum heppii]
MTSFSPRVEEYDDESCRDFLVHELGLEIPRFYRFNKGIHEVQKRIISRYGDENFGRAMAVFREMLEDADNAWGLGDDGDLWRSWRHDWRQQGLDLANPGTPHFPSMILPPMPRSRQAQVPLPSMSSPPDPESGVDIKHSRLHASTVTSPGSVEAIIAKRRWTTPATVVEAGENDPKLPPVTPARASESAAGPWTDAAATASLKKRKKLRKRVTALKMTAVRPRLPALCFDGAFDAPAVNVDQYSQTVNNNKNHQNSLISSAIGSSTTRISIQQIISVTIVNHSQHPPILKDHSAMATLTSAADFESHPALSMLGDFSPLDPAKYNPPAEDTAETSEQQLRYASLAQGNPFGDESPLRRSTRSRDHPRLERIERYNGDRGRKGMAQSQSEGQIAFLGGTESSSTVKSEDYARMVIHAEPTSPVRGRSTSPVKTLDPLSEEEGATHESQLPPRSRSPMKKMFGENGWLGRSVSLKELALEQQKKSGLRHWGGKIKQRVGGLDMTRLLPNPFTADESVPRSEPSLFPISLDPPTQAKLYSEIELMICVTANTYLMQQRKEGRMSVDSLLKVVEFWKGKGRPQVIEFQFDQATQRDLILYNLKTFRFHGQHANDKVAINSMMYNWKTMAKEMTVRTFCAPDAVVRKQMHDMHKVLELLGAPLTTFLAFQEIQVTALRTMRDEQRKRDEGNKTQYGIERTWQPSR